MTTWVTADHHFLHGGQDGKSGVIKYCKRPFIHVDEMTEVMIDRWNEVVGEDDTVYHAGDFSLTNDNNIVATILSRLNGNIHLLAYPWHHDGRWLKRVDKGFFPWHRVSLEPMIIVLTAPAHIVICHFPFEVWDRKHYDSYHFHGHSHGRLPAMENRVDIGVDCNNFYPFNIEELVDG